MVTPYIEERSMEEIHAYLNFRYEKSSDENVALLTVTAVILSGYLPKPVPGSKHYSTTSRVSSDSIPPLLPYNSLLNSQPNPNNHSLKQYA